MAVKFDVPKSPTKTKYTIDEFLGVDFSSSGVTMDKRRSPNAPNMIRNTPKKIRKRMGYKKVKDFEMSAPVYGAYNIHLSRNQANSAINTNRALGTSSNEQAFPVETTPNVLYTLGSKFHKGQSFNYSFDYSLYEGSVRIYFGNTAITLFGGKNVHVEGSIVYNPETDEETVSEIRYRATDTVYDDETLYIKNFVCAYYFTEDHTYAPAPEDISEEFGMSNIYSISEQNLSSRTYSREYHTYAATATGPVRYNVTLIDNPSVLSDIAFVQLEFIYSNSYGSRAFLRALYENSAVEPITTFHNNPREQWNRKIRIILPTKIEGNRLVGVQIANVYNKDTSGTFTLALENIKISEAIPKTIYSDNTDITLYHVGERLIEENNGKYTTIFESMNQKKSRAWQIDSKLYIVDGKNFLRYTIGNDIENVMDVSEIPLVTIGRKPNGGGVPYNDRNLIQAGYEERFAGTKTDTEYQMSFYPLDENSPVVVEVVQSDGSISALKIDTDYWVDYEAGVVVFSTAPGESPVTGEDNVYITAYRTTPGYAERILNCTVGTMYGVNGDTNRLFLSGNQTYPNYDWYSEVNDPTYFADTSYSVLGSSRSPIVGYLRVGNYLATIKNSEDENQSVFIRSGEFSEDGVADTDKSVVFKVVNTLQSAGAITKDGFGYLKNEPLFLTKNGIMAITSQDVTGEKLSQSRSFYLDGRLKEEANLENAYVCVFNDYYIVAVNNKFYMLDGLQPTPTDVASPYSTRLYSAFYCDNIPAYVLWENNGELYFGTNNGVVYKFYNDVTALSSYNDDGSAISAYWETPDIDGNLFYKNKTFRYLAVRMMSSLATSIKIWGEKHGIWTLLKYDEDAARYFAFSKVTFSKFNFLVDKSEKITHTKMRIKKVDKARFRLENSEINEPFGIFDFALEYIESGNYKG